MSRNHLVYTGSFGALEKRWMDTVFALQADDPLLEIGVLVGSNLLASYLKRRIAASGRIAANLRFFTFLDLAQRLAGAHNADTGQPRLPRQGAAIILENLLAEKTPDVYASLSGYRGFRDALLETFRDLRDAGISPEELTRVIEKNRNPDRHEHLLGFSELYRKQREHVGFFRDVDDDFRLAIRNTAKARDYLGFGQLLVYGIYDVTGQQSKLLAALSGLLDMVYFVPFVDETVSEFARPFIRSRAAELSVKPIRLQTPPPVNSLERLASGDFGFSGDTTQSVPCDNSFGLVSAPGESRAAIEIAREILRAIHDRTIKGFHEAAVILRQPESDIPVIAEVFRLRGIPYFVHGGRSFAECPLAKAILALSRLDSNSFSREAVLEAMELVAAVLPEEPGSKWDVPGWRALTNSPRFLAGTASWESGTANLLERARAELAPLEATRAEAAEDDPEKGIRSLQASRKRLAAAADLREAWKILKQAAADWPVSLPWRDWASMLENRLEPLLGKSEEWHFFALILDEIGSLESLGRIAPRGAVGNADGGVPVDRLKSAIWEAISSRYQPVGRFQRTGVNILSASAARGLRFPLVIIPGLDEGRFPAKLRQDPLLLDSERSLFAMLPVKSKRVDEEKLLFDMAARSAEKRLVLMTSRLDESSDREKIPSQFFLRVASAVHGKGVGIRDLSEGTVSGFRSVSLDNTAPAKLEIPIDEGEIRLRAITSERTLSKNVLRVLAKMDPQRLSRPLQYDESRWVRKLTSFDGSISDPPLLQWTAYKFGAATRQVSASRIEEYMKCPYMFFLKRVMDLQAWEEQTKTDGMDPLERGIAIHSILEQFLRQSGGAVFHASSQELWPKLESCAIAALSAARPAGIADLLWDIEKDALLLMLKHWLEFETGRADPCMRVAALEQVFGDFGPEEKYPSFRLEAGRHAFDFRGRIDRVDFSDDRKRARVVDYKTGTLPESMASKSSRTPLMSGERIQLAIYAGALSVLDAFIGVEVIEGEYLHLQPKNSATLACAFTHDELQNASRSLPDILEIVGDGIESGRFFARTSGKVRPFGHCEYCDYLPVCGKDRIQKEERKAQDAAVRRFLQVVEPL